MTITATVLQGHANASAQTAEIFVMYCLGCMLLLMGVAVAWMMFND